jgi:hypothetical protein
MVFEHRLSCAVTCSKVTGVARFGQRKSRDGLKVGSRCVGAGTVSSSGDGLVLVARNTKVVSRPGGFGIVECA